MTRAWPEERRGARRLMVERRGEPAGSGVRSGACHGFGARPWVWLRRGAAGSGPAGSSAGARSGRPSRPAVRPGCRRCGSGCRAHTRALVTSRSTSESRAKCRVVPDSLLFALNGTRSRPKKCCSVRDDRAGGAEVARRVVGERGGDQRWRPGGDGGRRVEQRQPGGIGRGGRVAVGVGLADGGDRAPEVPAVLLVPAADRRVGAGQVGHRQHPRAVGAATGGCRPPACGRCGCTASRRSPARRSPRRSRRACAWCCGARRAT